MTEKRNKMWSKGFEILQNIQDIFNLKNMKRNTDKLARVTQCRTNAKWNHSNYDNEENDFDIKKMIPAKILQMTKKLDDKSHLEENAVTS